MPATDGIFLPPEYQQQIDELQQRRQLALAMAQRSMQFQPAQSQGAMASRTPLLGAIAQAASGVLGQYGAGQAQSGIRDVQKRAQTAETAELQALQAGSPDEFITKGQASRFPGIKALAKQLYETRQKNVEAGAKITGEAGDPAAALGMLRQGRLPDQYSPTPIPGPEFGTGPNGQVYATTTNRRGEKDIKFPPVSAANINLPGNEGREAIDFHRKQLEARQGEASIAKETLTANSRAVDALEQGARAGGGESLKQALRKGLQAFGIATESTASTEQLQQAMGAELLNNARKLAPVTGTDIKVLEGLLGNINTDPTALTKAIAFNNAMALKTLKGYNSYVTEQNANLKNDYARDLFSGATKGYEMPQALYGPQAFQFETIRNLQNIGGDISGFNDPATGKPFAPGSKFDIRNPAAGFPGAQQAGSAVKPPAQQDTVIDASKMTPEQLQQLMKLLGVK
jgi:hypothetical protein